MNETVNKDLKKSVIQCKFNNFINDISNNINDNELMELIDIKKRILLNIDNIRTNRINHKSSFTIYCN